MMTMPAAIAASMAARGGLYSRAPAVEDYGDQNRLRSFCIAFRPDNKIHLFAPARQTAHLLRITVEAYWAIDSADITPNCYTLNLEGAPFLMYSRRENALLIKYICCLILEQFRNHGWELVVCTDLSSKTDLTTWYFARAPVDAHGRPLISQADNTALVCLSLSSKRKLQLINASAPLQNVLRDLVVTYYELGLDQDAHYGRDYQIKLKGTPWDTDNRDEIVAACKLIIATIREFGANGYHLYGLVNLKDTADSFFFEYDPVQTFDNDQYLMIALDDKNILRVVNASRQVVDVVKATIDRYWTAGMEAEGCIGSGKGRSPRASPKKPMAMEDDTLSWEFVLTGSPWRAPAAKIGRSRQFVTFLLDALLEHGWTVVTGLDISRALNKKSALLFQRCPPVRGLHHSCLSPLGSQRYQLINAPPALRHLVRQEFDDMVIHEKETDDNSVYELLFDHRRSWWVADPEQEKDSYIYTRKRMGRLLDVLMDFNWRVIASADVARQIREEDSTEEGEGIHSWFIVFCGSFIDTSGANPVRVTANSTLHVGSRVGAARPDQPLIYLGPPRDHTHHRASIADPRSAATVTRCHSMRDRSRTGSVMHRRTVSPTSTKTDASPINARPRRSRSGYDL